MTLLAAFKPCCTATHSKRIQWVHNCNRSEIEGLIGFVNSLVLRTHLGGTTFRELLSRVRGSSEAYAHQDLPLRVGGGTASRAQAVPKFQVVFALQNAPMALELPGLTLSPLQFVDTGTTRFDLEFHLWGAKLKGTTTLKTIQKTRKESAV